MLSVYQEADYAAMSRRAAHIIAAEIHRNPACVLGLATGSTPIGTYENLVAWNKAGDVCIEFSAVQDSLARQYYDVDQQTTTARSSYRKQHLNGAQFKSEGYKLWTDL